MTPKELLRHTSRLFRVLSVHNYHSAKVFYFFQLFLNDLRWNQNIIVYQMGKVGSTTIVRSLKASGIKMPVYHVHDLKESTLKRDEQLYKDYFRKSKFNNRYFPTHVWEGQYLSKQLNSTMFKTDKWKVITLVRDPIDRNISAFFQTLEIEFGLNYAELLVAPTPSVIEKLTNLFLRESLSHDYPLTWFDNELKGMLGLDVFTVPFPTTKGYKIYKGEQVDTLVIRLEDLNKCASSAFCEFLNIDNFILKKANISNDKNYRTLWKDFKEILVLPNEYVRKMYTSKYMRHFYTSEEIRAFETEWYDNHFSNYNKGGDK